MIEIVNAKGVSTDKV
jgi:hypothetical protein